ncbi:MAG: DUF3095 domain-containing protein [Planctomycetes bacterium]|nr:DUF3095 domain-containing protein [Planctomycetota bacterium]
MIVASSDDELVSLGVGRDCLPDVTGEELPFALFKMAIGNTDQFYISLDSFSDFRGIIDPAHFRAAPENWVVVVTDVINSTKAIEEGRFRDVNTIGAAAIASVRNALEGFEFPFVFGGDGATLLVPDSFAERARRALGGLKAMAESSFELDLRVGFVPVSEVTKSGVSLLVAKYKLIHKIDVAVFRGGGIKRAETMVKESDKFLIAAGNEDDADLTGLSCRWQPILSARGKVLALMVVADSNDHDSTYASVIEDLSRVFSGRIDDANPVNVSRMSFKSVARNLRDEKKISGRIFSLSYLYRAMQILMMSLMMKVKFLSPRKYIDSLSTHSDYRKFDDALRMVLDCTDEQIQNIEAILEKYRENKEIYYGLHKSDSSLMTCFVNGMDEGNHIHFIDGSDGGYAMAAKQLKHQMAEQIA